MRKYDIEMVSKITFLVCLIVTGYMIINILYMN